MVGYSGTPLSKKLGIKPGARVKTVGAPSHYAALLEPVPSEAAVSPLLAPPVDIVHIFSRDQAHLRVELPQALQEIHQGGAIWVSWPKKASGVPTDLTEDQVRELALPLGLVDVKVCAVDAVWSGLKLVIRKRRRTGG